MPEIVGECAEFFNPIDAADMARVIGGLLGDPVRRQELRRLGLARSTQFSWNESKRRTANVFRRCLGRPPVGASQKATGRV